MAIAIFAKDQFGQPLAGLTPTWTIFVDAVAGTPLAQPSFDDLGGGNYAFDADGLSNPAGIIDLGGLAVPRYALFQAPSSAVKVFAAFDANLVPLAGLTPVWLNLKLVSDGSDYAQPAIDEIGSGLYGTEWLTEHTSGVIDLGSTAYPRYIHYDSEALSGGAITPPVVSNLTPTPGTPVYPDTPLQFDLTDAEGFVVIIPMIILDPFKVPEPTARGVSGADFEFEGLYTSSTRVAIADGFRYTIRRKGGWYAAPRLLIWAVDINGNIWTGP